MILHRQAVPAECQVQVSRSVTPQGSERSLGPKTNPSMPGRQGRTIACRADQCCSQVQCAAALPEPQHKIIASSVWQQSVARHALTMWGKQSCTF